MAKAEFKATAEVEEATEQKVAGTPNLGQSKITVNLQQPTSTFSNKEGREPNMIDEKKAVLFLSPKEKFRFYKDQNNSITFKSNAYLTDNQEDIAMIRNSPIFNQEIYEKEYPEGVKAKMKKDKAGLTKHRGEYEYD